MTTPTQPTWRSHYTLLVLLFVYTMSGETLDPGEFKNGVMSVATTANHLDDIAQEKFGGKRFTDLKTEDLI